MKVYSVTLLDLSNIDQPDIATMMGFLGSAQELGYGSWLLATQKSQKDVKSTIKKMVGHRSFFIIEISGFYDGNLEPAITSWIKQRLSQ
jgi:hypothetical protein